MKVTLRIRNDPFDAVLLSTRVRGGPRDFSHTEAVPYCRAAALDEWSLEAGHFFMLEEHAACRLARGALEELRRFLADGAPRERAWDLPRDAYEPTPEALFPAPDDAGLAPLFDPAPPAPPRAHPPTHRSPLPADPGRLFDGAVGASPAWLPPAAARPARALWFLPHPDPDPAAAELRIPPGVAAVVCDTARAGEAAARRLISAARVQDKVLLRDLLHPCARGSTAVVTYLAAAPPLRERGPVLLLDPRVAPGPAAALARRLPTVCHVLVCAPPDTPFRGELRDLEHKYPQVETRLGP